MNTSKSGFAPTVLEIQQALIQLHFLLAGQDDGVMGPKTKGAIVQYQAAHGLSPDGVVGPKTEAQLRVDLANPPAPVVYPKMCVPEGRGAWVAFPNLLHGYPAMIPLLLECGIKWLAPRCGNGEYQDSSFKESDAKALIDAGIKLYPWAFSKPSQWKGTLVIYQRVMTWGCHGIIDDAEIPWEPKVGSFADDAEKYMEAFDKVLPDVYLGDAPWPLIGYHPNFPAAAFAKRVNGRHPQMYWTEINSGGAAGTINESKKQWAAWEAKHPNDVKPIYPIGITYGKEELVKLGAPPCPGSLHVTDMQAFEAAYPGLPVSWYSLEAAASSAIDYFKKTR